MEIKQLPQKYIKQVTNEILIKHEGIKQICSQLSFEVKKHDKRFRSKTR